MGMADFRKMEARATGAPLTGPASMTQPKRVLLVEDDAHIADLLTLHLRDERLDVVHCADGNEGLRQLEQGGWDALVLDIMLPGVEGLEIGRRARASERYNPHIIITTPPREIHRTQGDRQA